MAIEVTDTKEYIKIVLDNCYINKNGLYCNTIVYKDIDERNKDKERATLQTEFYNNLNSKIQELIKDLKSTYGIDYNDVISKNTIIDDKDTRAAIITIKSYVKMLSLTSLYYRNSTNTNKINLDIYKLGYDGKTDDPIYTEIKSLGYNETWVTDPVLINRTEIINIASYDKQDFSLDTFYTILKSNYKSNKTTVTDV